MESFFAALYHIFCCLMRLYGLYFFLLSLGCLFKNRPFPPSEHYFRFAILIPARNEECCISRSIAALLAQKYPSELIDIFVIPNNCNDRTAEVALKAGAQTLPVSSSVCSKGDALREAFAYLLRCHSHDAYCIFDADNEPNPMFLSEMNRALHSGARVAKSRILAKNPYESWVCGCYEIFFCNANRFLNGARQRLGLSARPIGTGLVLRRDLLQTLGGWNTSSLTEDAEFYLQLALHGEKVAYVPKAITYDEQPLTFYDSLCQRRRWMSGIIELAISQGPRLFCHLSSGGNMAFDALVQFSFHLLQALVIPCFLLGLLADPSLIATLPSLFLKFYTGAIFSGALALGLEHRLSKRNIPSLLLYPLFLFSFLPLQTLGLLYPNRKWKPIFHRNIAPES